MLLKYPIASNTIIDDYILISIWLFSETVNNFDNIKFLKMIVTWIIIQWKALFYACSKIGINCFFKIHLQLKDVQVSDAAEKDIITLELTSSIISFLTQDFNEWCFKF